MSRRHWANNGRAWTPGRAVFSHGESQTPGSLDVESIEIYNR
jgi:hypothetical protein